MFSQPENSTPVDSTDKAIVRMLQEDGRMSYREIGRQLHISEGTVRTRVTKLEKSGFLTISAIITPNKMSNLVQAFVLISTTAGSHNDVVEALIVHDEVVYISSCLGTDDIYIQVMAGGLVDLWSFINDIVSSIPGVQECKPSIEIYTHKISYRNKL